MKSINISLLNIKSAILTLLISGYISFITSIPVYANNPGTTTGNNRIWELASEFMGDIYTQILGLSTIAAVVTVAIALLMMNFSKNGKTVDESRAWIKRIITTWVILNTLGFIIAFITPYFAGGQWQNTTTP